MKEIRLLNADEIEARVMSVKEKGYSVLLYKDARCDMKILDEIFTPQGWQRTHQLINNNLFCTVSIWDDAKKQWINKQDVGTESYTEKEKGQASDSFKRASTNVGIGRELYTAPFIWINAEQGEIIQKGKSLGVYTKLKVSQIEYDDKRQIKGLQIIDADSGNVRFSWGTCKNNNYSNGNNKQKGSIEQPLKSENESISNTSLQCSICGIEVNDAVKTYSVKNFGQTLCREHQTSNNKIK